MLLLALPRQEDSCCTASGGCLARGGVNSLVAGSSERDHVGMRKRLTVLAYALFGFAILLAGVAIVGACWSASTGKRSGPAS
jgi:hypothetical protein